MTFKVLAGCILSLQEHQDKIKAGKVSAKLILNYSGKNDNENHQQKLIWTIKRHKILL